MAGPRVLFASIGSSLALVATAALSLLAVSAVFSFGGWSDSPSASIRQSALVFSGPLASPSARHARSATEGEEPILVGASQGTSQRAETTRAGGARPDRTRSAQQSASRRPGAPSATPGLNPPAPRPVAPAPPAAAATAPPASAGNDVRKLGEDVSSTVQQTGTALAQATAPLAPPISVAVQKVFNAVAALLSETTAGVGGAVDALLPPK